MKKSIFGKQAAICGIMAVVFLVGSFTTAWAEKKQTYPLWKSGKTKNKIVVISDLHLGVDDTFAETVKNRPYLVKFLQQLQKTPDVRELVIAGDFLDEWFLPLNYAPITSQPEFFQKVITNNQSVLNELQNVMHSGIKLVYVVGNHDMNMESKVLNKALPGIIQPRDAKGLGRYLTGDRKEIIIEHGHRYDPYSAPDRVSNKELFGTENIMYPPGYFYARIGTSWVLKNKAQLIHDFPDISKIPQDGKAYPVIVHKPAKDNADQLGAYIYAQLLNGLFHKVTTPDAFDAKIFTLKAGKFTGHYSQKDMYPVEQADGTISAPVLFRNFQRSWAKRQKQNKVNIPNAFLVAGAKAGEPGYFYQCAQEQYLHNPKASYEVVVFGHTHIPDYQKTDSKCYVNTGTWVDYNLDYPQATRTFAVIETGSKDKTTLYVYKENGRLEAWHEKVNQ